MRLVFTNLKRLLGLIIMPISFITPRNKRKWVFGSNMGYTGNAKHLFIHTYENYKEDIKVCWITDKKDEVKQLNSIGKPVAYKWSLKGILHCLTAKVYFYNSYVSDINEYTFGNVIRFNLWHGVALKHIERTKKKPDNKYISKNPLIKFRYFRFLIKPTFVLTSSPMETELFARSFAVRQDQCIESVYPRNEVLKMGLSDIKRYVEQNEFSPELKFIIDKVEGYDHCIIYMPTWRDSGRNFLEEIDLDLHKLNEVLKEINGWMLFKLHPATKLDIDLNCLTNITLLDSKVDIYPLLPLTDCLLTDYSSIYFDYALMKDKKIIVYIPDYEEYTRGDRDFAFPFEESVNGEKIYNFNDLIRSLQVWDNSEFNQDKILLKKFWDPKIKSNDELICFVSKSINLQLEN